MVFESVVWKMTLIKKDTEFQPEFDTVETLKMKKFNDWINTINNYLEIYYEAYEREQIIAYDCEDGVEKTFSVQCYIDKYYVCVAGYYGKSDNPYVKSLIENIFPGDIYNHRFAKYGAKISNTDYMFWRDDICFENKSSKEVFESALNEGKKEVWGCWLDSKCNDVDEYDGPVRIGSDGDIRIVTEMCLNLFWNIFLLALDDDIYNEQLPNVVELAHYWGFDEHMLRDWCRAVEYVMNGNQLSEDCDFECKTVEGAAFFLHKNIKQRRE